MRYLIQILRDKNEELMEASSKNDIDQKVKEIRSSLPEGVESYIRVFSKVDLEKQRTYGEGFVQPIRSLYFSDKWSHS